MQEVIALAAAFVYSEAAEQYDFGPRHPLRPERIRRTRRLIADAIGFAGEEHFVDPAPASEDDLLTAHSQEYLDEVRRLSRDPSARPSSNFGFLHSDNPPFAGMWEACLAYTGASVTAAKLILAGKKQRAFNVAGGLHHAMRERASGFCIINDCVVAIRKLLTRVDRVAYIDIDAHHGDGVQAAFYSDPRVLTVSIHETGRFLFPGTGFPDQIGEGRGRGFAVNLPLWPGTGDDVYTWAFDHVVPPLISAFQPNIIVTQLGADSHRDDPLTHLQTTTASIEHIARYFASLGVPWLALGGGGYSLTATPRIWAIAWCHMCGREVPAVSASTLAAICGADSLRDAEPTTSSPPAGEFAQRMVHEVERGVFPYHGI
ncbi:MAG: acetoin utilization protein AcuC [Armatimonadota bacterium]